MNTTPALASWSASLSDPGMVRTVNEDACLELSSVGLWVVADGMGGHQAGDVASRMIVESLGAVPMGHGCMSELVDDVESRLTGVHQRLLEIASSSGQPMTIGSTVAALLSFRRQAVCLWAGDSRVYRHRDGQFEQLTRDHSEVEELVAAGQVLPEDAETHPSANVITRAVGAGDELELEMKYQELRDKDRYLLCSDGLYKELADHEIAALLPQGEVTEACGRLVELARSRGARDNVTVVVIQFEEAFY